MAIDHALKSILLLALPLPSFTLSPFRPSTLSTLSHKYVGLYFV